MTTIKDTRLDCLINFTNGRMVECGDHKWVPIAHGVVAYTYRDRQPVEMDAFDAALEAGRIVDRHTMWANREAFHASAFGHMG